LQNNISLDVREMGLQDVDWMHVAQDMYKWQAPVNMVMNIWVP